MKKQKLDLWYEIASINAPISGIRLSESEVKASENILHFNRKRHWVIARLQAKKMLLNLVELDGFYDTDISILSLKKGAKPIIQISNHLLENIEISLSHSYPYSLVALSKYPISVDIEHFIDAPSSEFMRCYYSYFENKHIQSLNLDQQKIARTLLWGLKECYLKLNANLSIQDFNSFDISINTKMETLYSSLNNFSMVTFDLVINEKTYLAKSWVHFMNYLAIIMHKEV